MDRKKFALIKYDHGEPEGLSSARWFCLVVVVVFALGLLVVFPPLFPLSLMLGIVAVMIARPPKKLCVGTRYIICGKKILYYANIQRVTLEAAQGRLILKSSTGQVLVLEQENFHTSARKPHKIVANKEARFHKVARKIIERVRRAAPDAELSGIKDLPATGT